ncbi:MAG: ThiF family adenylyltransferase [Chloroflexota bacterium]
MYTLNNDFTRLDSWAVVICGCGGTGGFVAESMARLLPKQAELILVDFDRVEERNLIRQNFFKEDIGKYKSLALAERLTRQFDRPVSYSTLYVQDLSTMKRSIIIGCLDNGIARAAIARLASGSYDWWIDSGNGEDYGQVLIGNSHESKFNSEKELVEALPLPSFQRPEILFQAPPVIAPNCIDIPDQGPTINQCMATLVVETVHRLIKGNLSWFQLLLDLKNGTMQSVIAEPYIVKKMYRGKFPTGIIKKKEEK